MLTVVLKILSIVGIVLLTVLCVALALVLLVLFFPVSYRVQVSRKPLADAEGEGKAPPVDVAARASWFFGLLRLRFVYPDPGNLTVRVLFFKIFDSHAEEKPRKERNRKRKDIPLEQGTAEQGSTEQELSGGGAAESEERLSEEPTPEEASGQDARGEESGREEARKPRENPFVKFRSRVSGIVDRIRKVRENAGFYQELFASDDTRMLLDHFFRRLGRILRSIRPRKLRATLLFGTGSPDTTGYILGIYGMLSPHLGRHVNVTPDFERAVLEGEFYAAGHITLCKVIWHGLMVVLDKRLRQLIRKLKAKDQAAT